MGNSASNVDLFPAPPDPLPDLETAISKFKPLTVPREEDCDEFVRSFSVEQEEEALEFLKTFGFVVFNNVLKEEEIEATLDDLFGERTTLEKENKETWDPFFQRQRFRFAGIIGMGMDMSVAQLSNRTNPNVYRGFSIALQNKNLIVDHDRLGAMRPTKWVDDDGKEVDKEEWRTVSRWVHLDANPVIGQASIGSFKNNRQVIDFNTTVIPQGLITLTDAREADGGFHCVPGSHHTLSRAWAKGNNEGVSSMQVQKSSEIMEWVQNVPIRKGCLLVWTSMLFHGNHPNHSENWRVCQYIRMMPREGTPYSPLLSDKEDLRQLCPGFDPSPLGNMLLGFEKFQKDVVI